MPLEKIYDDDLFFVVSYMRYDDSLLHKKPLFPFLKKTAEIPAENSEEEPTKKKAKVQKESYGNEDKKLPLCVDNYDYWFNQKK